MSLKRISVTLPERVLVAADARARELDRSRSWVVAEALRRFLGVWQSVTLGDRAAARVREGHPASHSLEQAGQLGENRLQQLEADMSLTPDERVRAAENTALVSRLRRTRWERDRILTFDRYEDYLDWERWEESSQA